jgi:hypothetical protein
MSSILRSFGPAYRYVPISFHLICIYVGRLKSSWTHLITPSRNFVEVRWHCLFRSISFGKRWTSYNVPPTSRKRAADRNFLPRSSLYVAGKAQKPHVARSELYGGCSDGVPPIHFFQAEHRIQSCNADAPLRKYLFPHSKKSSFKTTVSHTLTTSCHYCVTPTTTTWHNYYRLPLHNSGALPPVHELSNGPRTKRIVT